MAMTGKNGVVYHDYTPEKMVELLEQMKQRGRAVTISQTGQRLNIDEAIEFYRRLRAVPQAHRA